MTKFVYFVSYRISSKSGTVGARCEVRRDTLITSINDIAGIEATFVELHKDARGENQALIENFILLREEESQ